MFHGFGGPKVWYIYLRFVDFYGKLEGKYTDRMGLSMINFPYFVRIPFLVPFGLFEVSGFFTHTTHTHTNKKAVNSETVML